MTNAKQSIYDVRRDNLRLLIQDYHGSKSLAIKLGLSNPSFISHLAGPNPQRVVTEKTSRKFEQSLGLEDGWMDKPNKHIVYKSSKRILDITPRELPAPTPEVKSETPQQNQSVDMARLSDCLERVLSKGRNLTPKQLSKLATVLYSSTHSGEQLDAEIDTLIDLMSA